MEGGDALSLNETEELKETVDSFPDGKKKLLTILIGSVAGLALHGFLAYYITKSYVIPRYFDSPVMAADEKEIVAAIEPVVKKVKAKPSKKADKTERKPVTEEMKFVVVNHIVINPYGTNGRRFLALDLSIGTTSAAAVKDLEKRDAELRDKLNTLLSRKTIAELTNIISKRKIKKDIIALLNGVITKGEVREVYFTKYVLQ
ncbi:MAG: flagellar basal body-associated FliL family protein [Candidatus Marinimicrobia bacterium]|nr:flagellar basal body-associated FliL family protein [Candidatus Neomarinimicrobiota bacterium]